MKTGRSQILICRSLWKRNFQKSTVEKVLDHLLNIKDFKAAEKRAEELIQIIEDERNTEADIIAILERMEDGKFITIMKNGAKNNENVKNARKLRIRCFF